MMCPWGSQRETTSKGSPGSAGPARCNGICVDELDDTCKRAGGQSHGLNLECCPGPDAIWTGLNAAESPLACNFDWFPGFNQNNWYLLWSDSIQLCPTNQMDTSWSRKGFFMFMRGLDAWKAENRAHQSTVEKKGCQLNLISKLIPSVPLWVLSSAIHVWRFNWFNFYLPAGDFTWRCLYLDIDIIRPWIMGRFWDSRMHWSKLNKCTLFPTIQVTLQSMLRTSTIGASILPMQCWKLSKWGMHICKICFH